MDLSELKKLAISGESATIEFKKSTADLAGACESLCGMLNAGLHARVIIGISGGKLVGQEISDRTQQEIARAIRELHPDPQIQFSIIPIEGTRGIIVLQAQNAKKAPYFFRGKAFFRIGTTTSLLSPDHLKTMIVEQNRLIHSYDGLEAPGYSLEDLDYEWILRAVELGIAANRLPVAARGPLEKILDKFHLLRNGHLTYAAIILFGKADARLPLQCTLNAARFKGTKKGEFLDHKQFIGNAFQMLDEGMMFLSRHLPLRGKFEKNKIQRIDAPIVPTEALREALLNAICHRDYEYPGASIHLAIYEDRVDITNNGCLMPGIQMTDLKKQHKSILRNPLIARVLYYTGLIEQWGTGTLKMIELCMKFGLPEPEFLEHPLWFEITFKIPSGTVEKSQTRREKILELLRSHTKLTTKELASLLPTISRRMIQRELKVLKQQKLIQSSLKGPATIWSLHD